MSEVIAMRKNELKLFIIEFNKASQLDRSFSKAHIKKEKIFEFRKRLIDQCLELMVDIDNNKITNNKIRNAIRKIKEIDKSISYGQAQKVINVCLKQYMFITNKLKHISELDCPLDSTTMRGNKIKNNKMINVTEVDYINYQKIFEKKYKYKILKDLEYDNNRIKEFFNY